MTGTCRPARRALRVDLYAPVASFRDPRFPGVSHGLPLPPPSTIRGLLAAATGTAPDESVPFALAARSRGEGIDLETYHPIAADGSNPARGGRVPDGSATVRERHFLTGVDVTLWIPYPHAERIRAALRRPVWPLRLGRSQDLVFIKAIQDVLLEPCEKALIGHALAPADGHDAAQAEEFTLTARISADRLDTAYESFRWCRRPAIEPQLVRGAYRDGDQAVWLLGPDEPPSGDELAEVLAKSAKATPHGHTETLTEHSSRTAQAARSVAARIGLPGVLARYPQYPVWVHQAGLLHDTGKLASGFQRQLRPGGPLWGHRHEVLSLAYAALFTTGQTSPDRDMIHAGVAFHHRPLTSETPGKSLTARYPPTLDWARAFGYDPDAPTGRRVQVPTRLHRELTRWLAVQLNMADAPDTSDRKLWEIAKDAFADLRATWSGPVDAEVGLVAVLVQGAVTLADHSASAHVALQEHMPLPTDYLQQLPYHPHPHQKASADTIGHLLLIAPTGTGKTEAGLAWASRQLPDMPGQPRLFWTLPYRASIDATAARLTDDLQPPPNATTPDIAILHGTVTQTLLAQATTDDCGPSTHDAVQARARAATMRLFAQRIRVATPHQLLRAAIAGPRYSAMLLEQANALIVLDELHAYNPAVFGRICAAMQLWDTLGSRIAILSATMAPPMIELLQDTLNQQITVHNAPPGTAPPRHRLALDPQPITAPESIARITDWLTDNHSVLIVTNTVDTAQQLFRQLADAARTAQPADQHAALLLHARFRRKDRARIENAALARHPERRPGQRARRGGLLIATQCIEVSLCLDLDRGATELAPVEASAQRAGRVNRRGLHPDGPVEFRIHTTVPPYPYDPAALDAALKALSGSDGQIISEQSIENWLRAAYDTDWGRTWANTARHARDTFTRAFLTFTEPFDDRTPYETGLGEQFDSVEVVHIDDLDEYRSRLTSGNSDPLLAAGLLIPIRYTQYQQLCRRGEVTVDRKLNIAAVHRPYSSITGLDLTGIWNSRSP